MKISKIPTYFKNIIFFLLPSYNKIYIFEKKVGKLDKVSFEDIELSLITKKEDLQSLINQRDYWYDHWSSSRFQEGNLCFALKKENKIRSCLWTSFNKVYLPTVHYNLFVKEDIVPLLDGWTSPNYRNKGYYSKVLKFALDYLSKEDKYKKVYFFIRPDNLLSLKIHKDLEVVLEISTYRLFGINYTKKKRISSNIDELMNIN